MKTCSGSVLRKAGLFRRALRSSDIFRKIKKSCLSKSDIISTSLSTPVLQYCSHLVPIQSSVPRPRRAIPFPLYLSHFVQQKIFPRRVRNASPFFPSYHHHPYSEHAAPVPLLPVAPPGVPFRQTSFKDRRWPRHHQRLSADKKALYEGSCRIRSPGCVIATKGEYMRYRTPVDPANDLYSGFKASSRRIYPVKRTFRWVNCTLRFDFGHPSLYTSGTQTRS